MKKVIQDRSSLSAPGYLNGKTRARARTSRTTPAPGREPEGSVRYRLFFRDLQAHYRFFVARIKGPVV